jgi:hypothetical protein
MPTRPLGPCRIPSCPNRASYRGYCAKHKAYADNRPSSASRGYGTEWRKIREQVLSSHNIPKYMWSMYDIHHEPAYDASKEPDHTKYRLTPMLHEEHSKIMDRNELHIG